MKRKLFKILDNYNVNYIILTHAHIDHIWNAQAIKERYGAKIAIGKKDEIYTDNSLLKSIPVSRKYRPLSFIYKVGMNNLRHKKIEIDDLLEDNQIIEKNGITLKIVDLEGHTPGSIGILDSDNNLYCGDALISRFGEVQKTWQNNDNEKALESLNKIKDLDIKNIYFGHGVIRSKEELDQVIV